MQAPPTPTLAGDAYRVDRDAPSRGCKRGEFMHLYDVIAEALGEPKTLGEDDEAKLSTEWTVRGPADEVWSIYDWKSTARYYDRLPTVEKFRWQHSGPRAVPYVWQVGGTGDVGPFLVWLSARCEEAMARLASSPEWMRRSPEPKPRKPRAPRLRVRVAKLMRSAGGPDEPVSPLNGRTWTDEELAGLVGGPYRVVALAGPSDRVLVALREDAGRAANARATKLYGPQRLHEDLGTSIQGDALVFARAMLPTLPTHD